MEFVVEETVSPQDLEKFRQQYEKEKSHGNATNETRFTYAWCLVRSNNKEEMKTGCKILEELYHSSKDETSKRDYLFYIAVGMTRLKNYDEALKFSNAILCVEPGNHQAVQLCQYIEKKRKKDALIGMAVLGGIGGAAAIAIGGIVGMALSRK